MKPNKYSNQNCIDMVKDKDVIIDEICDRIELDYFED